MMKINNSIRNYYDEMLRAINIKCQLFERIWIFCFTIHQRCLLHMHNAYVYCIQYYVYFFHLSSIRLMFFELSSWIKYNVFTRLHVPEIWKIWYILRKLHSPIFLFITIWKYYIFCLFIFFAFKFRKYLFQFIRSLISYNV